MMVASSAFVSAPTELRIVPAMAAGNLTMPSRIFQTRVFIESEPAPGDVAALPFLKGLLLQALILS